MHSDPDISIEQVKSAVFYDPETGIFTRLKSRGSKPAGSRCDRPATPTYLGVSLCGYSVYAHRLAWFYVNGTWPRWTIDHINRNPRDNRITNLRDVPHAENIANAVGVGRPNKLGLKGVKQRNGKYEAHVYLRGKQIYIGVYSTPEEAHEASLAAEGTGEKQRYYKHKTHGGATITEETAREIKYSKLKGVALAAKYNVSTSLVWNIRNGSRWKHLTQE